MGLFSRFSKKKDQPKSEECVLIYLDAVNLPYEIYEKYDLSTLEDQLAEAIEKNKAGEFDGNEMGEGVTKIFTYGPDADRLYHAMESVLRDYPLCRNAKVVIRKGGPGSPQKEVQL
jgi:hypothetical protein